MSENKYQKPKMGPKDGKGTHRLAIYLDENTYQKLVTTSRRVGLSLSATAVAEIRDSLNKDSEKKNFQNSSEETQKTS